MWMTRSTRGRLAGLQIEGPASIIDWGDLLETLQYSRSFSLHPRVKKKNSKKTVQESKQNIVKGMIYHVLAHRRGEKGSDIPSR